MGLNHHDFETLLDAAYRAGFKGIEVPAHAFGSVEKAKEAGKRLEDMGSDDVSLRYVQSG